MKCKLFDYRSETRIVFEVLEYELVNKTYICQPGKTSIMKYNNIISRIAILMCFVFIHCAAPTDNDKEIGRTPSRNKSRKAKGKRNIEEVIDKKMGKMITNINLEDDQVLKIRPILEMKIKTLSTKKQEIDTLEEAKGEANKNYMNKMLEILSEDQMIKFKEIEKENKRKRRKQKKSK